ncbi:protein FAM118A isoform X1 [Bubalus kerabau]|uniref:protein FAM118A isoform X1 n=1 Tax=Bubalus carabanensis TaxID=3119969 RepID=UPI00244EF78D|nr:protein FAM118A isoform X1 [Bubalus carabanensis]XP_055419706.1 protein FAM118A isoform X1 [Bubalus carabanensis]
MDSVEKTTNRSEQKSSRKFLKSLIRKQPQELLLVIGTGVSAAVAPGIPALCSWRSCIEAVIEAAEQLEVLHPGDVAEFRRKVTKDGDLLVVAHDLIRKMSPRTGDAKPSFFQDCLMEVFDDLERHIQNPLVLQSILSLMERGTMVLTTNYDNLLEIFGQQQSKPMESLDLKDKTKVLQWARGHIRYGVLHIHGLYTDPCGMVLDPSGYKDVTQDPEVMARQGAATIQHRTQVTWCREGSLTIGEPSLLVGAFAGSSPEPVPHQVLPVRGLRGDAARPDLPGPLPVLSAQQGGPGALHAGAQGERGPFLQASGRHASARHQGRVLRGWLRRLPRVRARPRHSDLQAAKSRCRSSGQHHVVGECMPGLCKEEVRRKWN